MKTKMLQSRKKRSKPLPPEKSLAKIFTALDRTHPDAKLDLNFSSPLQLLIALILAAQARDELVNQITVGVFSRFPRAENYAQCPLAQLEEEFRKINFYRNKARLIQNCCRQIVERFSGKVPDNADDLTTLPGVGRKTANILLGNAFGREAIGVDTHVMRLSQRLGLSNNSQPDKIELDLVDLVPARRRVKFCHLLQYHGRRVCRAKGPRCPECTINSLCPYPDKTANN